MYGKIFISTPTAQAQLKTTAHSSIYTFLVELGYSHEDAADVADWAEIASVGEEYELRGASIVIAD